MTASLFSLLLFMQLSSRFFASGLKLEVKSKICGADHIAYWNFYDHELFYLNGNLVDKVLFCKALQLHYDDHCVFEGYAGTDYCGLDLSLGNGTMHCETCLFKVPNFFETFINGIVVLAADLSVGEARKLLQERQKEDDKSDHNPNSASTNVRIAAAGTLLTCFAFICPCLFRKKGATAHTVLTNDPNSMDSASPLEMNVHSLNGKVPAIPQRVPPSPMRFSMSPKLSRIGSVHLSMEQVARATLNFSSALQIGEGGFGTVYKAQLDSGQVVAIKRANKEHFENLQTEFSSEVELLAKIDHRNLVKLLGYIDRGNERLIITEYVPNGTLRDHLDGQRGKILDFKERLEIAIDVAHGLTYLHLYGEKQIIHRDIKSSNILLTESMRAKVADFGFARVGPMDSNQTHISTKVKGTVGYLDPEYMKTYQLTTKSDVYSFGVLLIEILTGRRPVELRRPVEERVTLRWAFRKYNEGHVVELVDQMMKEVVDATILEKMFGLAIQCAAPRRNDRPEMKSVGEQLWAIRANHLNLKS